jgi:hypothetical protein
MAATVMYDGRVVPVEGFRVFVYGPDDTQKLANSWKEYQELIASGLWFSHKDKVVTAKKEAPRESKKKGD